MELPEVSQRGTGMGLQRDFGNNITPSRVSNPTLLFAQQRPRTHISTTDRLDPVYRPTRRVGIQYAAYFQPTFVTDAEGHLNENLATDLVGASGQGRMTRR